MSTDEGLSEKSCVNGMQLTVDLRQVWIPVDKGPSHTDQDVNKQQIASWRTWGHAVGISWSQEREVFLFFPISKHLSNTHCRPGTGPNAWLFWPRSGPLGVSQDHSRDRADPDNRLSLKPPGRRCWVNKAETPRGHQSSLFWWDDTSTLLFSPPTHRGLDMGSISGSKQRWSLSSFSLKPEEIRGTWRARSNLTVPHLPFRNRGLRG